MAKPKKKSTPKKKNKSKRSAGRPCILNDELQNQIVKFLHAGAYIETACAAAGIHKDTLYDWLKRAAASKKAGRCDKFSRFSDAVEKAMAEAELDDLDHISKAAASNWQAAAWRLERKYPERYGRRVAMEHTGKDGKPLNGPKIVITLPSNGREVTDD